MAVITNVDKVKTIMPGATDEQIALYDNIFNSAEKCLSNYSQNVRELAVAYAVAHMIELNNGGRIESERTRQGASIKYAMTSGKGLESTTYGQALLGLPAAQCIISYFSRPTGFAVGITPCR